MKPRERHELKTNELAEWLFNLPQQIKENLKTILLAAAGIVLVVILALWYWYYKTVESVNKEIELTSLINRLSQDKLQLVQTQSREADSSYILITTADNLQTAAQNAGNSQASAAALIKRAEALRTELHYRAETPEQQDIATQIEKAKTAYNQAIEKAAGNPSLTAAARFGLGLCEEDLGNFEQAKKIYGEIAAEAKFEGTVAVAQAKERLRTMDDYRQKIEFRPAPKPPVADINATVPSPNSLPLPAR